MTKKEELLKEINEKLERIDDIEQMEAIQRIVDEFNKLNEQ